MKLFYLFILLAFSNFLNAASVPDGLSKETWASIRKAYEAGRHAIHEQEDGRFVARNPGQQWRTEFNGRGFVVNPQSGGWTWGLELESYGMGTLQRKVSGRPKVQVEGQGLSYLWDENVREWYLNDGRGLEHGFVVQERPAKLEGEDNSELIFHLSTVGSLFPRVHAQTVDFRNEEGATVLSYAGLKVWDSEGTILHSRFEAVGGKEFCLTVEEQGATYPLTIDPIAQQVYLKASNAVGGDLFGNSVSVSGNTVVVGAPGENGSADSAVNAPNGNLIDAGAVYVFEQDPTTGLWTQQAYLKASNASSSDNFGDSVSVSDDIIVVGAPGERGDENSTISAPNESAPNAGAAYIFERDPITQTWTHQVYLKAYNTAFDQLFGKSVSISGDTVVIGAPREDGDANSTTATPNNNARDAGAAYVFKRDAVTGTWTQQAYLKAFNAETFDNFGDSVSISSNIVVVGAAREGGDAHSTFTSPNNNARDAGAAYVFERDTVTGLWSQRAYLKAFNAEVTDGFGDSVSVSGNIVAIGAPGEDGDANSTVSAPNNFALDAGASYIFEQNPTTKLWTQQAYLKASDAGGRLGNSRIGDQFGTSVSASGDIVVVGAATEDGDVNSSMAMPNDLARGSGAAYIFVRDLSTRLWAQQAYLKASNTGGGDPAAAGGDRFGNSVAVSSDVVVVGAFLEDGNANSSAATPNDFATNAGASYLFEITPLFSGLSLSSRNIIGGIMAGELVGILSAQGTFLSDISYSMVNGQGDLDNERFVLGGENGDQLLARTDINRLEQDELQVRIQATDSRGRVFEDSIRVGLIPLFRVTFDVGENGMLNSGDTVQNVQIDEGATAPTITPNPGWRLDGWDQEFSSVTADLTIRAQYVRIFEVTFSAGSNGTLISGDSPQVIDTGTPAVAPGVQANPGFTFTGWDRDFSSVTEDLVVTAQYEPQIRVTFLPGDNGSLTGDSEALVDRDATATAPQVQANLGFTFVGWDQDFSSVTEELIVTAQYEPWPTVTFLAGERGEFAGGLDQVVHPVPPGGSAVNFRPSVNPDRNWVHIGFNQNLSAITEDIVTSALYRFQLPGVSFAEPISVFTSQDFSPPRESYVTAAFRLVEPDGRGVDIPIDLVTSEDFFLVQENGQPIPESESFLQVAKFDEAAGVIRTVLLLDNSFSVAPNLAQIKEAAKQIVSSGTPNQKFAVYSFSGGPANELQGFTQDVPALQAAIDSIGIGSPTTNLYGAITNVLPLWNDTFTFNKVERGFLVVLTDGDDQAAISTLPEVIATRGNKQIYTIGLGDAINEMNLDQIGNAGSFPINSVDDLESVFEEIQEEIENDANSFYWVNYVSPKRGNNDHSLEISIPSNPNRCEGSTLTATFNSVGFTDVSPEVVINRGIFTPSGESEILVNSEEPRMLEAFTILGFVDSNYTWEVTDSTIARLEEITNAQYQLFALREGMTEITVTDVPNNNIIAGTYVKTIPVQISSRAIPTSSFAAALASSGLTGGDALPTADPNGDGIENGIAYALGIPLIGTTSSEALSRLPQGGISDSGNPGLLMMIPENVPDDVTLCIEASPSLASTSWTEVARKASDGEWTGTAQVTQGNPSGGFVPVMVPGTENPETEPKKFMRLRVEIAL